jgi:hypothetical protein
VAIAVTLIFVPKSCCAAEMRRNNLKSVTAPVGIAVLPWPGFPIAPRAMITEI